ncbi:MAG TPA: transglycosylase domain-containing protein [Acidobacteriaceae bacterium]|nr:transglycosylase domain-containing protein [Acidobacteriaceae bacterium]
MALKVKVVRDSLLKHPVRNIILLVVGGSLLLGLVVGESIFGYYYFKYRHAVDDRLQKGFFEQTAKIYAAPKELRVGQKLTPQSVAQQLRTAGYSTDGDRDKSKMGTYALNDASITIEPGPQSYHSEQGATVTFDEGKISKISGDGGQALDAYELEPQLITGLSEGQYRTKRRLVTFDELPPNLVNAVTSIEDRRFFEHGGVDYYRILGALRDDLRSGKRREGGSTLTMQLARGFFLTPEKRLKRKIIEIAITFQLESRFNKKQIFQLYANEIPLGQQGSFAINGFGQAAQTYFGKDVRQLDLAQCALLAGMIQHPSYLNPYRHPDRAIPRRNRVLDAMVETGKITQEQAIEAKAEPLKLAPMSVDAGEAPYFVDLVRDRLVQRLGDADFNHQGLRIYTSLDPDLQAAATAAVAEGMKEVDAQVEKLHARRVKAGDDSPIVYPQVALVALNPHTGQVLALVGGRNYGMSQLDHAIANRPTGSIFKPFVYAAAFNTSLAGTILTQPPPQAPPSEELVSQSSEPAPPDPARPSGIFTAITMLNNDLTTFEGGYSPSNYHNDTRFAGDITALTALEHSENNATVSLAQMVGYNNVAALAREAGIKNARGTPSVALGSYGATPIDMAGAYTTFANSGVKIDPWLVSSVRNAAGDVLSDYTPNSKPILDPRVAYLTLSLMENVINAGTGARVRAMGFTAPAAGKTGTSHDAWFAGFTSNLLCVVWIGNDDYTDVKLEGAKSAAPLWAEFMKRAVKLPEYSDTRDFELPNGVSIVRLDKVTNLLADASCPQDFSAAFLDGTAPVQTCDQGAGDQRNMFQKLFGIGKEAIVTPGVPVNGTPASSAAPGASPATTAVVTQPTPAPPPPDQQPKKKRGFFAKLFGKGDKQQQQQDDPAQPH